MKDLRINEEGFNCNKILCIMIHVTLNFISIL